MCRLWKSARSGEQKPVRLQRRMKAKIFSVCRWRCRIPTRRWMHARVLRRRLRGRYHDCNVGCGVLRGCGRCCSRTTRDIDARRSRWCRPRSTDSPTTGADCSSCASARRTSGWPSSSRSTFSRPRAYAERADISLTLRRYLLKPHTHTHTHTRLMALFPGLPGWAGTRKVKPIWILLKQETVSGSGISWATCKSAPHSRQITMPAPHHSVFFTGGSPTNSIKALKARLTETTLRKISPKGVECCKDLRSTLRYVRVYTHFDSKR